MFLTILVCVQACQEREKKMNNKKILETKKKNNGITTRWDKIRVDSVPESCYHIFLWSVSFSLSFLPGWLPRQKKRNRICVTTFLKRKLEIKKGKRGGHKLFIQLTSMKSFRSLQKKTTNPLFKNNFWWAHCNMGGLIITSIATLDSSCSP